MLIPHYEPVIGWDMIETHLEHHGSAARVYYSTGSAYWTHQRGHAMAGGPGMPCPIGGQIVAEPDWRGWLAAAREAPEHYGAHGLAALLAAHHQNCRHPQTGGYFAAKGWKPYNLALDAWEAENARVTSGDKPKRIDLTAPKTAAFANARRPRRG